MTTPVSNEAIPRAFTDANPPTGRLHRDAWRFAEREGLSLSVPILLRFLLGTPGFQFVLLVRAEQWLAQPPVIGPVMGVIVRFFRSVLFRCEVSPKADIGGGLYVPHPYGIVIGSAAIGADVTILQNMTVDAALPGGQAPTIGDGAYLGVGAVVLGAVAVGAGATVGPNAVVLDDVPSGTTVVGNPARALEPRPGR